MQADTGIEAGSGSLVVEALIGFKKVLGIRPDLASVGINRCGRLG
jgi:hypothetical protein